MAKTRKMKWSTKIKRKHGGVFYKRANGKVGARFTLDTPKEAKRKIKKKYPSAKFITKAQFIKLKSGKKAK